MAMISQFFDRLRPRRSVLQRTRRKEELPEIALYLEWFPGTAQRKILDAEGKEHTLDDTLVESNYKLASGGTAKKLIAKHWAKQEAKKEQPYVAPKAEPEPPREKKPKPAKKAKAAPEPEPEKKAKKATKKAAKKKTTKKAAKKKKATKKTAAKKATKKSAKKKKK